MMIADLIKKNRACRKFYQNHIDVARLSASVVISIRC